MLSASDQIGIIAHDSQAIPIIPLTRASNRLRIQNAISTIHADGGTTGDGGRVIVFSEELTHLEGEISARGGDESGDGGFVETSGLAFFHIAQTPDASAPAGEGGERQAGRHEYLNLNFSVQST